MNKLLKILDIIRSLFSSLNWHEVEKLNIEHFKKTDEFKNMIKEGERHERIYGKQRMERKG